MGVSFRKASGKWEAQTYIGRRQYHVGTYGDEDEAGAAMGLINSDEHRAAIETLLIGVENSREKGVVVSDYIRQHINSSQRKRKVGYVDALYHSSVPV